MRSNNRSFWLLLAAVLLVVGIYPFTSPVDGEGVVPAAKSQADSAPLTRVEAQELLRPIVDANEPQLLRDILEETKKQTEILQRLLGSTSLVAQNNGKIYDGLVAAGAFTSSPGQQEGAGPSSGERSFPSGVSIKLDPSDLTERYKAVQIDNHKIAIGDTYGNEFLWQYDPAKDKLELLYMLHKDKGVSGLVVCNLDKEVGYVQVPDGIGIMTPSFPIPEVIHHGATGVASNSSASQPSSGKALLSITREEARADYEIYQVWDDLIEVADKHGNSFRWSYEPVNGGLVLRWRDVIREAWVACLYDKEAGGVKTPSGFVIMVEGFPVPHVQKDP